MAASGAAALVFMAGMTLVVVVVGAVNVRVKDQPAGQIIRNSDVCQTGDAAEHLDAGLHQRDLRTGADAAAEDDVCAVLDEKADQCAVALTVGGGDLTVQNGTVFDLIELELFGTAKVLEDHPVFKRNCDFHADSPLSIKNHLRQV